MGLGRHRRTSTELTWAPEHTRRTRGTEEPRVGHGRWERRLWPA